MQRIDFEIEFVRILYKLKTKKSFKVRLELQDKEGNQLKGEQMDVGIDEDVIQLNSMGKYELFLIAGEEKTYYLPFSLHFISNERPVIKRKIPIRLHSIHQHYLDQYETIGPLEQIYTFQQGEIIYRVNITKSQPIIDEEEMRNYDQKLCVLSGSTLESLIQNNFLPQLSRGEEGEQRSGLKSSSSQMVNQRIERLEDASKLTSRTQAEADQNDSEEEDSSERGKGDFLESWQRFSEIYEQHPETDIQQSTQKPKDINLTLKLICILISVGFIILLFNAFQGQKAPMKASTHKAKPKPAKAAQKKTFKAH